MYFNLFLHLNIRKLVQKQGCNHTWDLKYVSCGVDSTSADAISKWRRIWRKEGLFLGLQFLKVHTRCLYDQSENYKLVKHLPSTCAAYFLPLAVMCTCFMDITSTVWGGSWSRRGSSQVLAAGGCCSPHPRWWLRSPHLCKGSLLSTFPTAPLQRTLKQSEVLFIQDVWMRSWYV